MKNERRSGATRTSQPIQLRETRYMSRDEILRELRNRPTVMAGANHTPASAQLRTGGAD